MRESYHILRAYPYAINDLVADPEAARSQLNFSGSIITEINNVKSNT
jgi:hypothetical protein